MSMTTNGPAPAGRCGGRAEERQPRLLLARDDAGVEREAVVEQLAELVAVLRVASGAGGERDGALGLQLVDHGLVVGKPVRHPLDRPVREPPGRVDAFAEARDLRQAFELVNAAVLDVRDE